MATEFISSLNGSEYTSSNTWETHTTIDLTAATTKVFSHSGITGTVSVGATVTGAVTSTTGTVAAVVTSTQILLTGISGAGFNGTEKMEVDASNYVTSTDTGDSAICVLEAYSSQTPIAEQFTLLGSTTSATNYRVVRAASGSEHGGNPTSGVRWEPSSPTTYQAVLNIEDANCVLKGVVAKNSRNLSNAYGITCEGASCLYDSCITTTTSNANNHGFTTANDNAGTFRNCLAYDCGGNGFYSDNYDYPTYQNCTAINNNTSSSNNAGFMRYGNNGTAATYTNCVAFGNTGADFAYTNVNRVQGSYNASGDSTEIGTNPITTDIVSGDFVDHANDDWHIGSGSTLYGAGTDLSGSFTHDIDGDTRTNWSVGMDDGPAAAAGGVKPPSGLMLLGVGARKYDPTDPRWPSRRRRKDQIGDSNGR